MMTTVQKETKEVNCHDCTWWIECTTLGINNELSEDCPAYDESPMITMEKFYQKLRFFRYHFTGVFGVDNETKRLYHQKIKCCSTCEFGRFCLRLGQTQNTPCEAYTFTDDLCQIQYMKNNIEEGK